MITRHPDAESFARSLVDARFGSLWKVSRKARSERCGLLMFVRDDDPGGHLVRSRKYMHPSAPWAGGEAEASHRGTRRSDAVPYELPIEPLELKRRICTLLAYDEVDRNMINS